MGWRTVNVNNDDTLQLISSRHLGTAARWTEIAVLNDLKPPYIDKVASEGVIGFGGRILLPIFQADPLSKDNDTFLTDIGLDIDGFIVADGVDLTTVSQEDNLKQALSLRTVTSKKSLLFHPDYGSWAYTLIGHVNTESLGVLAAFYTKSALLEDPRAKSVDDIQATVTGEKIYVKAVVSPVYGEAIVFEKVI